MSKELESLEALKFLVDNYSNFKFDFSIIETALKRLENIDNRDSVIGPIEEIPTNTISKKIKALEIIKEKRVNVQILYYSINVCEYNQRLVYGEKPLTQDKYDLLKEVLL